MWRLKHRIIIIVSSIILFPLFLSRWLRIVLMIGFAHTKEKSAIRFGRLLLLFLDWKFLLFKKMKRLKYARADLFKRSCRVLNAHGLLGYLIYTFDWLCIRPLYVVFCTKWHTQNIHNHAYIVNVFIWCQESIPVYFHIILRIVIFFLSYFVSRVVFFSFMFACTISLIHILLCLAWWMCQE